MASVDYQSGMRLAELDTIDVPAETANDKEPIHIIQRDHPAWPNATFDIRFDYNNSMASWTWAVRLDGHGVVIERQPAEYSHIYPFGEYILFTFLDLSQTTEAVTPSTLGSDVNLFAIPGLESPGYGDWIRRQNVNEEREAELLAEWHDRYIE